MTLEFVEERSGLDADSDRALPSACPDMGHVVSTEMQTPKQIHLSQEPATDRGEGAAMKKCFSKR